MINSVRQTVLGLLNKNKFGYIAPSDFNLFAKQAQLEIFEEYFVRYNAAINAENSRQSGTGYADSSKPLQDVIDTFSVTEVLPSPYDITALTYDLYQFSRVALTGSAYEAENIPVYKIPLLNASHLTSPSIDFPAYTQNGTAITMYPDTGADIDVTYLRLPLPPNWTYLSLQGGEPVFNASSATYQDFELPVEDEYRLVQKICQYCGLTIREPEVVQYVKNEETETMTKG
jgi:hypothetical protein